MVIFQKKNSILKFGLLIVKINDPDEKNTRLDTNRQARDPNFNENGDRYFTNKILQL